MVFHESALAIDVDVVAVLEAQADPDAGAGKRDVVVLVEGRVVDHDGVVVRDLGQLGRRGRYEVAADPQETARRRQAALMAARQTLAGAIAAAALTIP
jgi:protocatechuate 3,4-dioxygenase beta subunit